MPSEPFAFGSAVSDAFSSIMGRIGLLPDDPMLRLALISAFTLGVLTVLVMLQVLMLSELASRRERQRQAFIARWRPCLAGWSMTGSGDLPAAPQGKRERLWFMLLWARLQRQLRGIAAERLNQLFAALGMTRQVLDMLEERAVHRRLVALTCLRYLADRHHWSVVRPLLGSANPTVALTAAQSLVAMDPPRTMRELMPMIGERVDLAMPRLVAVCRQAGQEAVTGPLLEALDAAPRGARQRLVRLLICADPLKAAPWARQRLRARFDDGMGEEDTEAHCAALQCLGHLRDPRDRPQLVEHFRHSSPRVRLAALEAFRHQAAGGDADVLLELLADRDWWVRQLAADVLVALPGIVQGQLTEWQAGVDDRYGRDALTRAMAGGHH